MTIYYIFHTIHKKCTFCFLQYDVSYKVVGSMEPIPVILLQSDQNCPSNVFYIIMCCVVLRVQQTTPNQSEQESTNPSFIFKYS